MEYTGQSPHQVIEMGNSTIIVINGDCAEVLKELHESEIKFNSAITSPPYAVQLNRNCVLIEKSEQYYNLIIERLLQYGLENYL